MADISGNTEEMVKVGRRLADDVYQEYAEIIKKIYEEMDRLRSSWGGVDQIGYIGNIFRKKPSLDNLGAIVKGYGVFLIQSAGHVGSTQDAIADAGQRI